MDAYYNDHIRRGLEHFLNELKKGVYTKIQDLDMEFYLTKEPVPFEQRLEGEYKAIKVGERWGELWDCAWFHVTGKLDDRFKGKNAVLLLDISGEGLIYDSEGNPVHGITNIGYRDRGVHNAIKKVHIISNSAKGDEDINFYMDCGCNDLFGNYHGGTVNEANMAICNTIRKDLYFDYYVLFRLMNELDKNSARHMSIFKALYDVMNLVTCFSDEEMSEARKILKKELSKKGGNASLTLSAIGHSHLDLAWLWPIRETKRKMLRTFSNAINNIKLYPEYIYGLSQPQQLEWTKSAAPKLYDELKKYVAEGRIELQGGMWVEPDLNVSSGESLVRQLLYGKKYYMDEFGYDIENAWLPDVFGFNGALPQILAKSGIKYLCTIKLSWNNFTRFPHHSFIWKGIDGESSVLVHMPPEGNYNSEASPWSVKISEKNYIEKGFSENAMLVYGIGDGGGGPSDSHIEYLMRQKDLNGLCPVVMRSAKDFFKLLEKEKGNLETFKGEMYLERHQGTYTTQGRNKFYNRRMETILKDAEFFAVLAQKDFPKDKIDEIWKEVLLYQFHDILPGSSIKRVYDESVPRYIQIEKETLDIIDKLSCDLGGDGEYYLNTSPFEKTDFVKGNDGAWHKLTIPAYSSVEVASNTKVEKTSLSFSDSVMENDKIKVTFGSNGEIVSGVLKDGNRKLVNLGNALNVYNDDGDCWDIADKYLNMKHDCFKLVSSKTYIEGNAFIVREQEFKYNNSTFSQKIILNDGFDYLIFKNKADWHEKDKMLRSVFEYDLMADRATFDIQFGKTTRPTTSNDVKEKAQIEVCAQKYVDYAQPDAGVAILNRSKYGYRVKDGMVSINLLRSPSNPGKEADMGEHTFDYAMYLHGEKSEATKHSYNFINDFYKVKKAFEPFVKTDMQNIVIESIKPSEDNASHTILRMFECDGRNTDATLSFNQKAKFEHVNLMEKSLSKPKAFDKDIALSFKPFEIKTIKIIPQ